MTDSPDGGPLSVPAQAPAPRYDETPRTLAAYGEGHPLPSMTTDANCDAFEAEQGRGSPERS